MRIPLLRHLRRQRPTSAASQRPAPLGDIACQRSVMGIAAADPDFVYEHGWAHIDCNACGEVVYDGRLIDTDDAEDLQRMHRASCKAGSNL